MTPQAAMDLMFNAMIAATKMVGPLLLTTIVVGVIINIIQTVTSIRDMSLTFVPKVLAAMVVLSLTMPWMIGTITSFFQETYSLMGVFSYNSGL